MTQETRPAHSRCEIAFTVEAGDLAEAQRLHGVARLLRWRNVLSAAVLAVLGAYFGAGLEPGWAYAIVVPVGVVAALTAGVLIILATTLYTARRTLRIQRSLHGRFHVSWDATGVITIGAHGRTTMAWGEYVQWRENESIILLYHSDHLFQFLPKRVLDEAQIVDLRSRGASAGLKGSA